MRYPPRRGQVVYFGCGDLLRSTRRKIRGEWDAHEEQLAKEPPDCEHDASRRVARPLHGIAPAGAAHLRSGPPRALGGGRCDCSVGAQGQASHPRPQHCRRGARGPRSTPAGGGQAVRQRHSYQGARHCRSGTVRSAEPKVSLHSHAVRNSSSLADLAVRAPLRRPSACRPGSWWGASPTCFSPPPAPAGAPRLSSGSSDGPTCPSARAPPRVSGSQNLVCSGRRQRGKVGAPHACGENCPTFVAGRDAAGGCPQHWQA